MKKVTYEEWQKNPTPRMMWVWNDDLEEREKQKVVYVIKDDFVNCPVLAVSGKETSFCLWCHCAEIEEPKTIRMARTACGGRRMTDNDFMELIDSELKTSITVEQIPTYKKAILKVAKKLNAENKKCKEIIKRTVAENFCCNDCKEVGLFGECQKKRKLCEDVVSDWFDEFMGW